MNDLLELLHSGWDHAPLAPKAFAIDLAVDGRAGKCRFDRGRGLAFVESVNGRVGVVNRNAGLGEQFCGGGLPHPDRAGQPKDQHSIAIAASRRIHTASSRSLRRNASNGSSGRPRMVK